METVPIRLVCMIPRNTLLPLYLVCLLLRHQLVNCKEGLLNSSMIGVPIPTKQIIDTNPESSKIYVTKHSFTLISVKNWLITGADPGFGQGGGPSF